MTDIKTVREIAATAFTDAVEMISIIEVLNAGNKNGATEKLNAAGAGRAAGHIQRALFSVRKVPSGPRRHTCASSV